jgi:hypothetical protein
MADVPLSLAVISTITPVVAGALPLTVGWIRDAGRDKRAAAERLRAEQSQLARKKRAQCVKLLRLARDFRVLVENTYDSTGTELDAHAEQVRRSAADIASQADEVEFMVPGAETEALSLATAARLLAVPVAAKQNRAHGSPLLSPDFTEFDRCLAEFKQAARAALSGEPAIAAGRIDAMDRGAADPPVLEPAIRLGKRRRGRVMWQPSMCGLIESYFLCPASCRASCLCAGESGGSVASIASLARFLADALSPARSKARAA